MSGNPNNLTHFWQELKRRKVVHVITVYAAAAFVILELTDIVAPSLGLPDWTLNLIIVLLVVGFVVTVIFSWIYDIHPEGGIVKTAPAQKKKKQEIPRSSVSWKIATLVSGVIIIALLTYNIFGGRNNIRIDESLLKSVAVLPFHNLSGDQEQEYICDGLTDEIISQLYKIESFDEVRSFTSIMNYRDPELNIPQIAEELNVNYILEGTFKRIGDEMRVTAQLIDPQSDKHIWQKDYDLPYTEVMGIPAEIALQIADHLNAFISQDEQQRIEKIPTRNQEAFELFQQIKYNFLRREYFGIPLGGKLNKVIELDPDYADAYAWLGFAALTGVSYGADNTHTTQLSVYDALTYVNKALELDPDNAGAYSILGIYNIWIKWDYPEAEKNLLKAADLEPNNNLIKIMLANFYLAMDRMQELASIIPAIERESELAVGYYARLKNHQGFREAREKYLEFAGDLGLPPIGEYYIWLGEYDSARSCFDQAIRLGNLEMSTPRFKSSLALAYHQTGDNMKAREIIHELIIGSEQSLAGSNEYFLGLYYSGTGDTDSAFYWLEKAYNRHSAELYWLRVNPILDNIREDPRYRDLYERTGHKAYDDYLASRNK
jgi:TolB-like protein/TPR repeat protein